MFSCALDPAVTAGITKGLELGAGSDGDARRARLQKNSSQLRSALAGKVQIGRSRSWIVPVIFGSETISIPLSDWLQRHGLEGSVMSFPAVPMDEARIRLFVTSEHSEPQIQRCADIVIEAGEKLGFALSGRV
jgi:7-keto-8-aminopelargonate synthetase-like enzyme